MKFLHRALFSVATAVSAVVFSGCESVSINLPTLPTGSTAKASAPAEGKLLVYFGTYTRRESKGIYVYEMDLKTGTLTPLGTLIGAFPMRDMIFSVLTRRSRQLRRRRFLSARPVR